MTHGSLFSGIGGFDLAAEWMGWDNLFHCEWNPFGQKVLNHYWPHAESFTDITKTDFTKYANRIDILSGGFPCQPYSTAGKRKGTEDERHLWPQMCRAIREIQPRWVLGENVRGLTNWNGGLVFDQVQADLEAEGYEVLPFLLPACAVNAPHRRDRIWFVAYAGLQRQEKPEQQPMGSEQLCQSGIIADTNNGSEPEQQECGTVNGGSASEPRYCIGAGSGSGTEFGDIAKGVRYLGAGAGILHRDAAHSTGEGLERRTRLGKRRQNVRPAGGGQQGSWSDFPTQSALCSRNDGVPSRLAGITIPKHRNESLKAYGNAIVPAVAYEIFKAIEQYIQL